MSNFWRWSQSVDGTRYPERERSVWGWVERYFRGFTAAEKTELWDRWRGGELLKAIGRAFGKPSSIYFQLAPHVGIRRSPRRRSRLALTLAVRMSQSSRYYSSEAFGEKGGRAGRVESMTGE